jgi:tetratricopeptide (TPR) repeat protein
MRRRKQGASIWRNNAISSCLAAAVIVLLSIAYSRVEERFMAVSRRKSEGGEARKLNVNVEKTIERAAKAVQDGNYERAAKLSRRALNTKDNWQSWLTLGIALRAGAPGGTGGVLPAITAFENCLSFPSCKDSADAWFYYASALACTPKLATAKHAVFKSLGFAPDNVDALVLAARLTNFSDTHDADAASSVIDKVKRLLRPYDQEVLSGSASDSDSEDTSRSVDTDRPLGRLARAKLHFALFAALDELGRSSLAAAHLDKGASLKLNASNSRQQLLRLAGQPPARSLQNSLAILHELHAAYPAFSADAHSSVGAATATAGRTPPQVARQPTADYADDHGERYCRRVLESRGDNDHGAEADQKEEDLGFLKKKDEPFLRPLFVVGVPRAGGTVLQQMLAAHPNILIGDDYTHLSTAIAKAVDAGIGGSRMSLGNVSVSQQIATILKIPANTGHETNKVLIELHREYLELLHADNEDGAKEAFRSARPVNRSTAAGAAAVNFAKHQAGQKEAGPAPSSWASEGWVRNVISHMSTGGDRPKFPPLLYAIDKSFSNAWWVGAAAPPCAKVIIVRRDATDLAFGNFKTSTESAARDWAANQTELGWNIALTERVLDLWESHLPSESVTSIRYEELVANPATVVRRLMSFLGLSSDERIEAAFASPEKTGAVIKSSSAIDLRLPLHKGSRVRHSERYASLMQDAMEAHGSATLFLQSQYGKFAGRTDKLLGDIKRKIAAMNRSGEWE